MFSVIDQFGKELDLPDAALGAEVTRILRVDCLVNNPLFLVTHWVTSSAVRQSAFSVVSDLVGLQSLVRERSNTQVVGLQSVYVVLPPDLVGSQSWRIEFLLEAYILIDEGCNEAGQRYVTE
ncbi:hypothetical protein, partial [Pseudomonas tremae]|uniref:hypothetical protein n=1 Tax=Pseudomonas tremae TaxID=200454 RepID=UPI001F3F72A0